MNPVTPERVISNTTHYMTELHSVGVRNGRTIIRAWWTNADGSSTWFSVDTPDDITLPRTAV